MNTPNNDQKPTDNTETLKQQAAGCGSGCNCNATGKPSNTRWVIGAIVLVVAGALAVNAVVKNNDASAKEPTSAFATTIAAPVAGTVTNPVAAPTREAMAMVSLGALAELNSVATNTDVVFVYLPGKEVTSANSPLKPMQSAASAIESRAGLKCGLFTLKAGSPDYDQMAGQIVLPGVLAMVKGRGMIPISGDITEAKLVQGFVSASSGGGCGPSAGAGCCPK